MNNLKDLLTLSTEYTNAHNEMTARIIQWNEGRSNIVRDTLKKIVQELTDEMNSLAAIYF